MIAKELALAGPGEYVMEFDGVVDFQNKFGRESKRFVFVNGKVQSNVTTGSRMLTGNDLDRLATQMLGRELEIGEEFDWESLVGKKFNIEVRTVNGFGKVVDITPVMEDSQ